MLTDRQKLTVERYEKWHECDTPLKIIERCMFNMSRSRRAGGVKRGRRHSRKYFQEIIDHFAQLANKKPTK